MNRSAARTAAAADHDDLDPIVRRALADLHAPLRPGDYERRPRIGVVLGAGGVQGGAYLAGAMAAVHEATGFEPRTATVLVGTSAGAVHAALYGAGLPAVFNLWRNRGGLLPREFEPQARASLGLAEGAPHPPSLGLDGGEAQTMREIFSPARRFPRVGPASPRLAAKSLLRPWAYRPEVLLAAWLPEGLLTNAAIGRSLQRIVPEGWVPHPRTWITAVSLRTGAREVFGRPDAPRTHLDRAVRASCAIPAVYRAVRIGRERYIDGGIHSPSNADLVAGLDLDLVVVVNPMSSLEGFAASGTVDRYLSSLRRSATRRLAAELRLLEEEGTPALVIQPSRDDLSEFSRNLMDPRRRRRVAERALETTTALLASRAAADDVALLRSAASAAA